MRRAAEKYAEPIFDKIREVLRLVRLRPGFGGLGFQRGDYHIHRLIKPSQDLRFRRRGAFSEFAFTVTDVPRAGDLRANVIIEIADDMQRQMSKAVSVGIRLCPELLFRNLLGKSMRSLNIIPVRMNKAVCDRIRYFLHFVTSLDKSGQATFGRRYRYRARKQAAY